VTLIGVKLSQHDPAPRSGTTIVVTISLVISLEPIKKFDRGRIQL
jgi:hypothetical protein